MTMINLSCVILLAGPMIHGQVPNRPIDNETQSLQLVSLSESNMPDGGLGTVIHVTLKNVSNKPIMAYSVGIGDFREDRNTDEFNGGLAPGATISFEFTYEPPHYPRGQTPPSAASDLKILAAFFADGSDDGDSAAIASVLDDRAGKKAQWRRIVALIDDLEPEAAYDPRSVLEKLMSLGKALPLEPSPPRAKVSSEIARSDFIQRLGRIKSRAGAMPDDALRSQLDQFKQDYQRRIEVF